MSRPGRVRIPADVERPDRILAGLTARQLAVLAGGLGVVGLGRAVLAPMVPGPVLVGPTAVVVVAIALLAFGGRDGLTGDRFALAALVHMCSPRRRVPAPEGVHPPPRPLAEKAGALPGPLDHPVEGIDGEGTIDLGDDGLAAVCRAGSVNFGLRTEAEQLTLVAAFGRLLNGLDGAMQIVVRAERADTAEAVAALLDAAPGLPHPGLEAAAREHAEFLGRLASRRDVVRRHVLVVFRQPKGPDAAGALGRRVDEAAGALAGAGVSLVRLDAPNVARVLAAAVGRDSVGAGIGQSAVVRGRR